MHLQIAMQRAIGSRTKLVLRLVFGAIISVLVVGQLVVYTQSADVGANVNLIAANALASIRLVDRMGMDVGRERILIDRHIFEANAVRMQAIERAIATTRSDYADAAREYAPLATFRGEAGAWLQLMLDVATAEQQTVVPLELSRANRDLEANQAMIAAEPTFDAVERDVTALVEINQAAATSTSAQIRALQRRVSTVNLVLALAIAGMTFAVGWWATRGIVRTEAQLVRHTAELASRNRELDAFSGRVAHDLRGPLNSISLATSIIVERVPEQATMASIVHRGVTQMTDLVEDLLRLSQVGAVPSAVARIEPVAAAVETDLGPRVSAAGGVLRVAVEPGSVRCSATLLRQVLWNLGENAVKYRRPDAPPRVEIAGHVAGERYELRVSDNGAGMSGDDVRRAFEPFFRGERARAVPGTGLGLAIVRRIVEASGGVISIDSRLDRGTTFIVDLPLAPA